jgi:hypothetical protein
MTRARTSPTALFFLLLLVTMGCTRCNNVLSHGPAGALPTGSLNTQQPPSTLPSNPPPPASASVDNQPGPAGAPSIASFTASPDSIQPGEPVTLRWSVANARHIGLSPYGTVTSSSAVVKPAATITYVLAATNDKGTSTARIVVAVKQRSAPRTLVVAPGGNDASGDGSTARPFASVQKAVDAAEPGDTVSLMSGTYRGAVRVRKPAITLASAPGQWAVIESPTAEDAAGAVVQIDPDAHETRLQRLEIVGGAYYGIFLQTTWDWGDPVLRYGPGHVVIEDCYIHDTGRDGIKVTPATDDVVVRRCTIARTGRRDASNADGIDNVNGDRMLVQDTWIHHAATNGIYFKGGSIGSRIERSLVTDCGGAGILLGFDTSPEFFDKAVNPDYYDCIDCIARNNVVLRTDYAGIGLFATLRSSAVHNTVVDAGRKGHSAVHFGLVLHDWEKGIPCPGNKDPVFTNNIVVQTPEDTTPMVQIRYTEDNGGVSGLQGSPRMAANRYYRMGGTAVFSDRRPDSRFEGNLAKWQEHVASDTGSSEGDPKLDGTLHLLDSSPCIDAAQPGFAEDDYDAAKRAGRPDVGADEAGAGPVRPVPPAGNGPGTSPR